MNTKPVRLTKFQRNELFFLLTDIMSEGFDDDGNTLKGYMSDSYGFVNKAEFDAFTEKLGKNLKAPSMVIQMTTREAHVTWGEFENRYDIEINNSDSPNDEYGKAAAQAKEAMRRVVEAFPEEEFRA